MSAPTISRNDQIVDIHGLRQMGIRYSSGYLLQLEKKGLFSKRRYLSRNRPVWILAEVQAWLAARVGPTRGGGDQ